MYIHQVAVQVKRHNDIFALFVSTLPVEWAVALTTSSLKSGRATFFLLTPFATSAEWKSRVESKGTEELAKVRALQ